MQKTLAILGVLLISAVSNPAQEKKRPALSQRSSEYRPLPAVFFPRDEATAPDTQTSDTEPPRWYISPEWWLCILGLPTLSFIGWQAKATADSARATKDAANAAYGSLSFAEAQMELMREEKRARLDLRVEPTYLGVEVAGEDLVHLIATVSVRNIGASKAFIGRTSGTLITNLRNEPPGDTEYSPLDLPEQFIEPDKPPVPVKVYCFPTATAATFAECLEAGTLTLHFFGFIEYETLGLWRRKEFGYDWKVVDRDSSLGGLLGLSDPYPNSPRPAKDRITYGYWDANEDRDKPEYPISSDPDGHQKAN